MGISHDGDPGKPRGPGMSMGGLGMAGLTSLVGSQGAIKSESLGLSEGNSGIASFSETLQTSMSETDARSKGLSDGNDKGDQSLGLEDDDRLGRLEHNKTKEANKAEDAEDEANVDGGLGNISAGPALDEASALGLEASSIAAAVGQGSLAMHAAREGSGRGHGTDAVGSRTSGQSNNAEKLASARGATTQSATVAQASTPGHTTEVATVASAAETTFWSQDGGRIAERSTTAPAWVGELPPIRQAALSSAEALQSSVRAGLATINAESPKGLKDGLSQQLLWMTSAQGTSSAKLILHPEGLGAVEVRISTSQGEVNVAFRTDSVDGQRLIADALPDLKQMLEPQGLRLAQTSVIAAGTQSDTQNQAMFGNPNGDRSSHRGDPGSALPNGPMGHADDTRASDPSHIPANVHRGLINTYA